VVNRLDLSAAVKIITGENPLLPGERVAVVQAMHRVVISSLAAKAALPGYDQSTRDGFVVAGGGDETEAGRLFRIVGEIPAGGKGNIAMSEGTSCRIMTGGMVPAGGLRVVPQEDCRAAGDMVTIPAHALGRGNTCIQTRGSQIAEGEVVVAAGTILQAEHSALLATTGHAAVEAYRKPRVGFFCTGSELVDSYAQLEPGLKISANHFLLGGLVRQFLAEGGSLGIVKDAQNDLQRTFDRFRTESLDVVISTGGMGPGKFDLLEEAFTKAGGWVIFRSLNLRPGNAILFGRLGRTLFFGLPGPPDAVRTLMNEIVGPALLHLQGVKDCAPAAVQASLGHQVVVKNQGVLHLKAGILGFAEGCAHVRLAGPLEIATCFILLPPGQGVYEPGSEVTVHLAYSPCISRLFPATPVTAA
jgi:molybdopterin molybdotransferase